jgi:uncharacterized membrane protein
VTLERLLANVLATGTWLAFVVIAVGLGVGSLSILTAGIACVVALPALRVAIMLAAYARRRDWSGAAIAMLVLAIIGIGLFVSRG